MLARREDAGPKADATVRSIIYRYAAIYDQSFYQKSAAEAWNVLANSARNFDALMAVSTAYQRLGRVEEAKRYVENARDLYPRSGEPASRLASLALLTGPKDVSEIVRLMETAVR